MCSVTCLFCPLNCLFYPLICLSYLCLSRYHLQEYLARLPLASTRQALKVLSVCETHGFTQQGVFRRSVHSYLLINKSFKRPLPPRGLAGMVTENSRVLLGGWDGGDDFINFILSLWHPSCSCNRGSFAS